jgi:hypothetical protein
MKKLLSNRQFVSAVWLVLAIIALILLATKLNHFSLHGLIRDQALREQAAAALIGSIFGALLGSAATTLGILYTDRKREVRIRDHDRRVKHYNSIVKLQRQMNVMRASLEDNTYALKSVIEANKIGLPTLQRPIQIVMDESHFLDLYDIELINMLNDLYYIVRRINLDSINLTRALDTLADHLFAGKITGPQYKTEVQVFNDDVVKIRKHILYMLDHSVLDIIAYVRICADMDASDEMKKRQADILKDRKEVTPTDLKNTREIIEKELKESEAKGLKEQEEEAKYD